MLPRLRGAIPPGLSPPLCLPTGSRRSPRSPRLGRTARHRRSARTARRERLPRAARAIGELNLGGVNPHGGVKRGGCSTPGTSQGPQPPRCCPSTLGSPCPGAGWGCAGPASPHQEPLVQALKKGRGNIGAGWMQGVWEPQNKSVWGVKAVLVSLPFTRFLSPRLGRTRKARSTRLRGRPRPPRPRGSPRSHRSCWRAWARGRRTPPWGKKNWGSGSVPPATAAPGIAEHPRHNSAPGALGHLSTSIFLPRKATRCSSLGANFSSSPPRATPVLTAPQAETAQLA